MANDLTLMCLQLNELNFPFIADYAQRGLLPNFKEFFNRHGFVETVSEHEHRLANPWIQWPTVHTGLDYADHKVFRLGDIVKTNHPDIYQELERHGVKVAALSVFNAANRTEKAAFFVPDPWTDTRVDAPSSVRRINDAFRQVTDDYAQNKISLKSVVNLVTGGASNLKWTRLPDYLSETAKFVGGKKWMRAVVGDRLLADAYLTQVKAHRPGFSTVFLNGGAHLQHHYMFSSSSYRGERSNPAWIVEPGNDPLLDVLKMYDQVLGDLVAYANSLPNGRVVMVTGLHQEPHERETLYYRLKDETALLRELGIEFESSYRLMTEDFVLVFADEAAAARAERQLCEIESFDTDAIFYRETGDEEIRTSSTFHQIFHVENRGKDLYVQLRPAARPIPETMKVRRGNTVVEDFGRRADFAQYKNTHHHGTGYYADSAFTAGQLPKSFPLRDLFPLFLASFGARHERIGSMDAALKSAIGLPANEKAQAEPAAVLAGTEA
ncbi:hypothetical protein [uncultured Sphingomonas sp.]|uniref:hypothetical protein n=1 Tax=uncultured Sphingomonas sp. TaxID=158754 RepID=UPI0035CB717B